MDETTTTTAPSPLLGAEWSDPLEDDARGRVRAFIEAIFEEELEAALGRGRSARGEGGARLAQRAPRAAGDRHVRPGDRAGSQGAAGAG